MKAAFLTLILISTFVFADTLDNGQYVLVNPGSQAGGAGTDITNAFSAVTQPVGIIINALNSLCLGPFCDLFQTNPGPCRTPPSLTRFGGSTTNIAGILSNPSADLRSISNFALELPNGFKLSYRSAVDVCAQDFDNQVAFGPGFFALNDSNLSTSLVRPSQPVSVILNYPPTITRPVLLYATGFHRTAAEILQNAQVCPPTKCQNVAFVNGKAIFDAASFSSYIVTQENSNPSPSPSVNPSPGTPSNEIKARCPVGLVVEENTTVSVFFTPNGVPTCVNQGMRIQAIGNNTPQPVTFISCDSQNGQHRFSVDTSEGGSYRVNAEFGKYQSQCVFDVVGRAPTPTPELPVWLALVAASLAFSLARSSKAKATGRKK